MTKPMRLTPEERLSIATRDDFRCLRCKSDERPATDVHHRRPRMAGGTRDPRSSDPRNLVLLCRVCHEEVESARQLARDTGWLLRSYDDLDLPLITKDGRRVHLHADLGRTVVVDAASLLSAAVLQ